MDATASENEPNCVWEKTTSARSPKNETSSRGRESSTDSSSATKSDISNAPENELINLDDIELSDEDTWLYTPPKNLSAEEKGLSPYKWLRQDVEDPNNKELQMAKTALVSKLDELEILKSVQKPSEKTRSLPNSSSSTSIPKTQDENQLLKNCDNSAECSAINDLKESCSKGRCDSTFSEDVVVPSSESRSASLATHKPLNDVTDVLERARQQEESLKESSSRFFSQAAKTLPRAQHSLPSSASVPVAKLSKPASVEALHMCNGKTNLSPPMNAVQPKTVISSPGGSPYGSTMSLSITPDNHRSSLPNLNRGYHSLRPKKAKRTSEPRVQCPLPAYPKAGVNGGTNESIQTLIPKNQASQSPARVYREAQTLPASYRSKSRNCTSNTSHTPLSRRESDPPPAQCQRNAAKVHIARRESMPTVAQHGNAQNKNHIARNTSPRKSLQNLSPFTHNEGSLLSLHNSRTGSSNPLSPEPKEISAKEHPRCSSHSPVKRQPLTSVHNYAPNQSDHPVLKSGNSLRKSSLPSKIPSPASRSGIPVPSHFMDRNSTADDSWSQDSY